MSKKSALSFSMAGLLLLVFVALYMPKVIGEWIEADFKEKLANLSNNANIDARVIEYKRGWFRSSAKSLLTINADNEDIWFSFNHDIYHGPRQGSLNYGKMITTIDIPEKHKDLFDFYFGDKEPLTITYFINFNDENTISAVIPSYVGPGWENENISIAWEEVAFDGVTSQKGNNVYLNFVLPFIKAKEKAKTDILFKGSEIVVHASRTNDESPWYGGISINLAEVAISESIGANSQNKKTLMRDAEYSLDISPVGDLINIVFSIGAGELTAENHKVSDVSMKATIGNIDRLAYEEIDEYLREADKKGYSQEYAEELAGEAIEKLLPKFLSKNPTILFDQYQITLPDGTFSGKGHLKYIGGQNLESFNPRYDLEGEASVSMDKSLFMYFAKDGARENALAYLDSEEMVVGEHISQEKLDSYVNETANEKYDVLFKKGFFKSDGKKITSEVKLSKGNIFINTVLANEKLGLVEEVKSKENKGVLQ